MISQTGREWGFQLICQGDFFLQAFGYLFDKTKTWHYWLLYSSLVCKPYVPQSWKKAVVINLHISTLFVDFNLGYICNKMKRKNTTKSDQFKIQKSKSHRNRKASITLKYMTACFPGYAQAPQYAEVKLILWDQSTPSITQLLSKCE